MKISPSVKKYLAALIIGSVISPTCSNVYYMQVQKIYLHTPVKPRGFFNTSHYHNKLFSQKCHFIKESSRRQCKDYCNSTHCNTYWHYTIDYTLLNPSLTLFSIWTWAVHAASIAHVQDWEEDCNTVGGDPKRMTSLLIRSFILLLAWSVRFPVAVLTVETCQQHHLMKDSLGENFWSSEPCWLLTGIRKEHPESSPNWKCIFHMN